MGRKNKTDRVMMSEDKLVMWFKIVIVAITMVFYYNATFNHFSMDDFYVNTDDPNTVRGIAGIPDIFTSLYAQESEMAYGYRPMVKLTYALEYQFTATSPYNPYISHFINILLYIIALLILYAVLRRLFKNYNPWFPFLIVLLFMAHPTHTEVVASLKNRDVLLNFIFSFTAIWYFVKWADTSKTKFIVIGFFTYLLALLSKETAIAQLAVFPLVLYFFTDTKPRKIFAFLAFAGVVVIGLFVFRSTLLPDTNREITKLFENPLIQVDNPFIRLSTCIYILGFYIKQMFVPFPLLYYYGYDMIPVVGWTNPWVLLSLAGYLAMLVIAVKGFKKKSFLSFIILYYFINISMYANIVMLVPGIVADRFVFFTTISMSAFVIWLLFKIFGISLSKKETKQPRMIWVTIILIGLLIPMGYYVHVRNQQWRTHYSLYSSDMPRLWTSVKANNLYAHEIMKKVNVELAKPVNPYKFVVGMIDNAEKHYQQALSLDSTHYSTWNNLGAIYSKIHANQAKLRQQSYLKRNEVEKADKEREKSKEYFDKAQLCFRNAIKYKPDYGSAYFNLANTYELQNNYDSSIVYFRKAIVADKGTLVSMSRLANAYYRNNQIENAVEQNQKIIDKYPNSDMPFINLGNYAMNAGDTISAIKYYIDAFKLESNPNVGNVLSQYFQSTGDLQRANYYLSKMKQTKKNTK